MGNSLVVKESEIAELHWIFSDNHQNINPASKNRTFHPYWCTFKQQIFWQSRIVQQEHSGYSRKGYYHHFQLQCVLGRNVSCSLCSRLCFLCLRNGRTLQSDLIFAEKAFTVTDFFPTNSSSLPCPSFASFNIFFHFWIGLAINEWRKN